MVRFVLALIFFLLQCWQLPAQSLTTGRVNYGLHVPINVKFNNSSGDPNSWIGLYKSDVLDGAYTEYQYIEGKKDGEISFKGEYNPGLYNFRLFKDNGYSKIATSRTIMIRQGMIVDPAFATDGFFSWNASSGSLYNGAVAAKITKNGKFVVAGQIRTEKRSTNGAEVFDFTVVRLLPDGKPDPTFGQNGRVTIIPKSSYFQIYPTAARVVGVQEDNKIVVGGDVIVAFPDNSLGYLVILVRLLENGEIDPSFGDKGVVLQNFKFDGETNGTASDELKCLEILPDQKILVGGGSIISAAYAPGRPFLGRFLPNGQPDLGFGGVGIVCPLDSIHWRGYIESIILPANQGDGTFYAAASAVMQFGQNYQILYRFNQNGSLDKSFGTGGIVTEHRPGLQNDQTTKKILKNQQGDIVMMGRTANYSYWMTKHNNINGAAVNSFGDNGVTVGDPVTYCADIPAGMVFNRDRIHIAFTDCLRGLGLSRFTPDGQIDQGFGHSIVEKRDPKGNYIEYNTEDFIQADTNRFIMVGTARYYDTPHWETFVAAFKDNPEIITSLADPEISDGIFISRNYPNPCTPSCKIPILLDKSYKVDVTLFDMLGRKIETIFKGNLEAGQHELPISPGLIENYRLKGSFIYTVTVTDGKSKQKESKVFVIE
jgi:uncharacterized delta-60 repeat protein